jgi:carbonic anhydrase
VLPDDVSYISYEGSLTTPPCTEGILWHVMLEPMKVTKKQVTGERGRWGRTSCRGPVTLLLQRSWVFEADREPRKAALHVPSRKRFCGVL